MKKAVITLLIAFAAITLKAQLPQGFKYQAIARDALGNELVNQSITVRLSILSGGPTGTNVWQEVHAPTTNAFGLYELVVGQGAGTGGGTEAAFAAIDWSTGNHYLGIEVDFGTGYLDMGTIQLLPTPYALYAERSKTRFSDKEFALINFNDKALDPVGVPSAFSTGVTGNIEPGTYDYKITYITDSGETGPGPASNSVTLGSAGHILISNIPVSSEPSVRQRGIYRRSGGTGDFLYTGVLNDNTTAVYTDNTSNADLGKLIPTANATEVGASFNISGLSTNQVFNLPDASGTLVIDTGTVSVKTVADRSLINHGRGVIQQLILGDYHFSADGGEWAEAYVDANGRNNSYSLASALFDVDKYKAVTSETEPFIVIEAEGISTYNDFTINGCKIVELATDTWQLSNSSGTIEEKRAKLIKTLFIGSSVYTWDDSYNVMEAITPRVTSTYINGLSAIRTNVARDVGKMAYYAFHHKKGSHSSSDITINGTFNDVTNNLDCSIWVTGGANDLDAGGDSDLRNTTSVYFPTGTTVFSHFTDRDRRSASDLIGTDLSAYEQDNPQNTRIFFNISFSSGSAGGWGPFATLLFLMEGSIAWDIAPNNEIEFSADENVPVFTEATESFSSMVFHTISPGTFSSTISSSMGTAIVAETEDGAKIQYKLVNDTEDSGWLTINQAATFAPFTSEPTQVIVKLIPRADSPTPGFPSIKGFYVTEL